MMHSLSEVTRTAVSFIDQGQSLISESIQKVYESLAAKKDMAETLLIMDNLIIRTEHYLNQRSKCQTMHECGQDVYAATVIERLLNLRNVIEHFGRNMAPAAASTEIRNWAELHIFTPAKRCTNCDKLS